MYTGEGKGGPDPLGRNSVPYDTSSSFLILDGTGSHSIIPTRARRSRASLPILYHPYYTVWNPLKKEEKKLLKLQSKAQECVSRKKAQKILKKYHKSLKSYPY